MESLRIITQSLRRTSHQENGNTWARITNSETIILFLKGMVGTGILAMPDAFKKGGLVLGSLGKEEGIDYLKLKTLNNCLYRFDIGGYTVYLLNEFDS